MMISLEQLIKKYNMNITGVVHVGAHLAEEAQEYDKCGIKNVWWIEGNPAVAKKIERHIKPYGHKLIQALVYSVDNVDLNFNITNYDGMSSSILEFGTHKDFAPDVQFVDQVNLKSKTIDSLDEQYGFGGCNFLNLDIQGAELHALYGATYFLRNVDYVFTEVNNQEVYVDCAKVNEIDDFLEGFKRVETLWVGNNGWGDALYVRV